MSSRAPMVASRPAAGSSPGEGLQPSYRRPRRRRPTDSASAAVAAPAAKPYSRQPPPADAAGDPVDGNVTGRPVVARRRTADTSTRPTGGGPEGPTTNTGTVTIFGSILFKRIGPSSRPRCASSGSSGTVLPGQNFGNGSGMTTSPESVTRNATLRTDGLALDAPGVTNPANQTTSKVYPSGGSFSKMNVPSGAEYKGTV